jgi:thioredoxin-related protein
MENNCKFVLEIAIFMKKALLTNLALLVISGASIAQKKTSPKTAKKIVAEVISDKEINWLSIDQVQEKMKKTPKKVYVDVYTAWCGWCKVMDQKTFTNPGLISYLNKYYYAVKFDAEQVDSVHFLGNHYGLEGRTNQFAIQLLRGQMSYPSTVILEENFQNPQVIPGYLEVKTIEPILKYFGDNLHKSTPWEEYSKTAKTTW